MRDAMETDQLLRSVRSLIRQYTPLLELERALVLVESSKTAVSDAEKRCSVAETRLVALQDETEKLAEFVHATHAKAESVVAEAEAKAKEIIRVATDEMTAERVRFDEELVERMTAAKHGLQAMDELVACSREKVAELKIARDAMQGEIATATKTLADIKATLRAMAG
jgi:hypothetical protein